MRTRHLVVAALAAAALAACVEGGALEQRSPSLVGTDTDGELRIDSAGEFVADPSAQWLFDYFLTGEGEVGDEMLRAAVVAEATDRLDAAAARRAVELFDAYVAFRREAAEVGRDEDISLDEARAALRDAHARHLGAAGAFAAELERIDRGIEVARVLASDDLDAPAKAARLEAILEPPRGDARALRPARAHREVREARARGASDEEIFAIRSELVGEEAARRLAALDAERQAFGERVQAYRDEVRALRERIADDEVRAEALEALRRERFNQAELLRLRALDRLAAAPSESAAPN